MNETLKRLMLLSSLKGYWVLFLQADKISEDNLDHVKTWSIVEEILSAFPLASSNILMSRLCLFSHIIRERYGASLSYQTPNSKLHIHSTGSRVRYAKQDPQNTLLRSLAPVFTSQLWNCWGFFLGGGRWGFEGSLCTDLGVPSGMTLFLYIHFLSTSAIRRPALQPMSIRKSTFQWTLSHTLTTLRMSLVKRKINVNLT